MNNNQLKDNPLELKIQDTIPLIGIVDYFDRIDDYFRENEGFAPNVKRALSTMTSERSGLLFGYNVVVGLGLYELGSRMYDFLFQ